MAMVSKTRNMFDDFIREGSFKWFAGSPKSVKDDDVEEIGDSSFSDNDFISQLSSLSNLLLRRCSRILGISAGDIKSDFDSIASESLKDEPCYARNLLEYCCFRALSLSMRESDYLADKNFRRLTFDMMLAWEYPDATSQPTINLDEDSTVGPEAFSRIAPAVPIISDIVICNNLFEVLTSSTGGRLEYPIYDKYLIGLERAIKKLKSQSDSSLLSSLRSDRRERIIAVDGTVTTQPVLQHVGTSTWPGRLILTDHALYFEPLKVVTYDKAVRFDLTDDLKQIVKPELTGPWGTRIFDKAVSFKSISISEPAILEYPELKGNSRRDYWLAIIKEILFFHRFIRKYNIAGVEREEALMKAVLGILRLQAILDMNTVGPVQCEVLLLFNLCDHLPGGDMILQTLGDMSASRVSVRIQSPRRRAGLYCSSALAFASTLGFGFSPDDESNRTLLVGEIAVGEMTSLEKVVNKSRSKYEKVVIAQESVDEVKVGGIDTNLAVMKELLFPGIELYRFLLYIAYWKEPFKSLIFCVIVTYALLRGWLIYVLAVPLIFIAIFMVLTRWFSEDRPIIELKVIAPPPKSAMEQLLAVQNAVSQAEEFIQYSNIILLKIRALLISIFPQATQKCALVLLVIAGILAFVPSKYIILLCFLEAFTRYSPVRKASTDKWERRLREWWFSIPAAPVALETDNEDKKRK